MSEAGTQVVARRAPGLCPDCGRASLQSQGPLRWCPACAYETRESQRVPDDVAMRLAEGREDAEEERRRRKGAEPTMTLEERVLRWIAERVATGKPVSVAIVGSHFGLEAPQAQRFLGDNWHKYMPGD